MIHDRNNPIRVEGNALGSVDVPAEHLWGAQTQRSRNNFPIGVERFRWGRSVIRVLGILKKCAALANRGLGQLCSACRTRCRTALPDPRRESRKGRGHIECANTLKKLTDREKATIVLDLSEATLADRDAAMSLAGCEFNGIGCSQCN
jgi:hypothetical protein